MRQETFREAEKLISRKNYLQSMIDLFNVAQKGRLCAVEFPTYFSDCDTALQSSITSSISTGSIRPQEPKFLSSINLDDSAKKLLTTALQHEIDVIDLQFAALKD